MDKLVVSVSFRHDISSSWDRKMPQIDPECQKTVVLSFLMQFLYVSNRTQSTQQRKNELLITFFEENITVFCLKNISK